MPTLTGKGSVSELRRELADAYAPLNRTAGWVLHTASAYTAHALFTLKTTAGPVVAHVVGTIDGRWWWGTQTEPGRVGEMTEAVNAHDACLSARAAARRIRGRLYERAHDRRRASGWQRGRERYGQQDGLRDVRGDSGGVAAGSAAGVRRRPDPVDGGPGPGSGDDARAVARAAGDGAPVADAVGRGRAHPAKCADERCPPMAA